MSVYSGKRSFKYDLKPEDGHVPNKDEAKLLRKIMADTKLTEEEVRSKERYRKMLAEVSREGEKAKLSRYQKLERDLMKRVTKELGLAKEHPKCIERYNELLKEKQNASYWWRDWGYGYLKLKRVKK